MLEPERELVGMRLHRGAGEVDAAEGTWVRGEDGGHRVGEAARGAEEVARIGAEAAAAGPDGGAGEEVGVDEDERRGVPDAAPSRGEYGSARGVLDGEAGDDVAEDSAGEGADAVDPVGGARSDGAGEGGGGGGGRVGQVGEGALRETEHVSVHQKEIRTAG